MVIRRIEQVCQSAPSTTRARRAGVRVRVSVSLCVCVCARACVCVKAGEAQPFLGSSTLRLQTGKWGGGGGHLWSFPLHGEARPTQAVSRPPRTQGCELPKSACEGKTPGSQVLALKERRRPVPGVALPRVEPGAPARGDLRARWSLAVPKPRGLLQVGEGEITIGVFTRCTGALEGLDACCWVSYSPWNSLSPCPIPSVGCQPEARAIRGGGTPRSVSLSPSMWVRGRSAYQVSSLHQTIGSGSRFFGEFWRLLTLASHTGCQERYTAGVYAGGRCLGGRRVSRPPGLPGGRSTGHRPFP